MSSSPPAEPRRSGRDRKRAEIFSSQPDPNKKRKRGSEASSDEDEVMRDEDKSDEGDEGLEEIELPPSDDDENDDGEEETYVAPRKAASGVRKPRASTSKAAGPSDTNGKPATKKPRVPRLPKLPKGPAKRRRKKGDEDADPKAIAKESAIADDNALFNAILNPSAALQSTAEDFLDSYARSSGPALADLMNCVLRACGSNATLDSDQVLDTDGVVDWLDDLIEAMKKETTLTYPLASKLPVFKRFRKSLSELLYRIIVSAAETGALYDEELIPILQTWVIAMSSAQLRSFRHTATVVALEVESALAEIAAAVDKEAEVLRRQKEGEKKKGTAAGKGKGREKDLQAKFDNVQSRKSQLKEFLKEFFDGLFVHRYRDADPGIRAECVQEFGVWLERYPAFFLEGNHLRYVGWVLSDLHTQVRLAAVKSLHALYKRGEYAVSTNHFTQRFKPRLVTMATSDIEVSVRVAVIQVLCAIDTLGELEEEQTQALELLVFDQEPRVRKSVSGFVQGVWKAAVDERLARRKSSGDAQKDPTRVGFKCLGSLLVRWAKKLETDDEGANVPDQAESQEGASDAGTKSKEVTALVSDLQRGRIALCVESLWDEIDAVSDWEGLIEFLLLDHSAEGDEDTAISPVTTKRKKAAEASARNRKGRRKSTVGDMEVDELWRLDDAEEAALVEVAVAALKKTVADAAEKKKGAADVARAEITEVLMKSLPPLFAKHQADERRLSEVILMPQLMALELYAEMGMNKAYEALWDDVTKHFLAHSSPVVIGNAAATIASFLATGALFAENNAKILQLEEDLSTGVRDIVAGRDDLDAEFLEDDEIHSLGGLALRVESLFRVKDMSAWMEEDEGGKQSSVWNIFVSVAARGLQGRKEEESMVDHAFQVLTFHVAWKVRHLTSSVPLSDEETEQRSKLQTQRDLLVETLESSAFGDASRACDGVRRAAVKCLLILHTLFLPKQGEVEGNPYPAASMPLEVTEEMQYRFDGFIEAEVERYADELVEFEEQDAEQNNDDEDSDSDGDGNTQQRKKQKPSKPKAQSHSESALLNQARLEKEYVFTGVIASFLSAMRAGVLHVKHAAKPLSYFGRLGPTFDQCMKVIIELLREEGMYKSNSFVVADVVKDAMKDSFQLLLDGRAPSDEHTISLAKALMPALVIRGAQLSIVQRLDGDSVVAIHNDSISWIVKKIAKYESIGNKKLRNSAIDFFHTLTQLLMPVESGEASTIKDHLIQALSAAKVEPSPTAKFWEPLRAYERRLTTVVTKDKEKVRKPAGGAKRRKSRKSTKSGDETQTTDDDDDLPEENHLFAASSSRRDPQRRTRSTAQPAQTDDEEIDEPVAPPRPRPKPKPKAKRANPDPDEVDDSIQHDEARQSASPSRTNGNIPFGRTPSAASPQHTIDAAKSPESVGSKRKRPADQPEEDQVLTDNENEDGDEEEAAPSPMKNTRYSRASSHVSQMSQLDIDFFKSRKRVRRRV